MITLEQLNDEIEAAQKAGNFARSLEISTRYFYKVFYGNVDQMEETRNRISVVEKPMAEAIRDASNGV